MGRSSRWFSGEIDMMRPDAGIVTKGLTYNLRLICVTIYTWTDEMRSVFALQLGDENSKHYATVPLRHVLV